MERFHLTILKMAWKKQLFKWRGIHGGQADSVIQAEKQTLCLGNVFLEITGNVLSITPVVEKEKAGGWKSASWNYNKVEKIRT